MSDISVYLYDSQLQHATIHWPQSGVIFGVVINLIYLLLSFFARLLFLSGDVELNPGPMIDERPEMSLLVQWLHPLTEWKQFGLCLTGISESDIFKIEEECKKIDDRKLAIYSKWLSVNIRATWRDIIDTLTNIKEHKLAQDVKDHVVSNGEALSTPSLSPITPKFDSLTDGKH